MRTRSRAMLLLRSLCCFRAVSKLQEVKRILFGLRHAFAVRKHRGEVSHCGYAPLRRSVFVASGMSERENQERSVLVGVKGAMVVYVRPEAMISHSTRRSMRIKK